MTALVQHKNNSDKLAPLFLAIAALVMLYLLYLDDGLYSFAWMASPVAWVLYAVYTIVLFIPQVLLARYVFKKTRPVYCVLLSSALGITSVLGTLLLL